MLQELFTALVVAGAMAWATAFYRRVGKIEGHVRNVAAHSDATRAAVLIHGDALIDQRKVQRHLRRRSLAQRAEIDELDGRVSDLEQQQQPGE